MSLLVWGLFTLLILRSDGTSSGLWMAGILLLAGFIFVIVGFAPKKEKEAPREEEELVVVEPGETAPQVQLVPQPVTREIYKEREIIREIVKIRCRNCGTLFEEKLNRCPHCGAPP